MVENSSFSDKLASVTSPTTDVDHGRALQALQSEIDYHRTKVGNGTYLDKAVSYVWDGGQSESQHKLELAYQNEKDNPNSLSRQDVTKLVKEDQSNLAKDSYVDTAAGLSTTALAFFGGGKGRALATALITANAMHPNDSMTQQSLEMMAGVSLGSFASYVFGKGAAKPDTFVGAGMQMFAYPLATGLAPGQWPNHGDGQKPNVEKIYNAPVEKPAYSPYSNLKPVPNSEWQQFDFLKK